MFKILKANKNNKPAATTQEGASTPSQTGSATGQSLFARLKNSLKRTRLNLTQGLSDLFLKQKTLDDALLEEIETRLLMADVGIEATREIVEKLTKGIQRKALNDPEAVFQALKNELQNILIPCQQPFNLEEINKNHKPYVIFMVGVNGSGKTTTIGKLTKKLQQANKSVMLAAGDTFRAAAIEQLQVWGQRHDVPVIAQHTGADSASVVFDAFQSAKSKGIDVLIADTAGRLHTHENLMIELQKIKRVTQKIESTAPQEIWLVLDATIGQNALIQAEKFHQAMGLTGIILTKLDGTAKGGIIFALCKKLGLPLRYIGVGETADDLRDFYANEFVQALFAPASDAEGESS